MKCVYHCCLVFKKLFNPKLPLVSLLLVGSSRRHFTYHSGINSSLFLLFSLSSRGFTIVTRTMGKESMCYRWLFTEENSDVNEALFPWGLPGSWKYVLAWTSSYYRICYTIIWLAKLLLSQFLSLSLKPKIFSSCWR